MLEIAIALILFLLVGFVLGLHVAVVLGTAALVVGLIFIGPIWDFFGHVSWASHSSLTIIVVPLYIMMGEILLRSGMTDDLYETFSKMLSRLPGGLMHTNIFASGVFAAVSGSSVATTSTIGSVAMPAMRKHGYSEKISLGSIASGGTLGVLIPPSIIMIVYGLVAEVSIGQLYIAAIVPGLIMLAAFLGVVAVFSFAAPGRVRHAGGKASLKGLVTGILKILPIVGLIGVVLGSIYTGVATSVEAAAYGVTGAFLIACCKRRASLRMLSETFVSTAVTSCMVILIVVAAFLLQFVLSFVGIPAAISAWVTALGLSQLQLIILLCVVFILLGTVMDGLAIVVATLPIFLPVLVAANVDLVWFGIIVVILVELALITPPVGMNLFVLQGVRQRLAGDGPVGPITDVVLGVLPFLMAMLAVLALIIAFPDIALSLVGSHIK
ncbi:TRAP transporter large permease [Halomonas sp. HK25]|uniref:TRAP transporter large permease n=1 Tax=Halomonas sp. HK25 TaxID=3394321 RepID=UPI0039FD6D09